jgi:hypothetical protein
LHARVLQAAIRPAADPMTTSGGSSMKTLKKE